MPYFGTKSATNLRQCHTDLLIIFTEVIKYYDCTILEGSRSRERQEDLFRKGKTKVTYPNSKHNRTPSMACDVAPYPVKWEETTKNLGRYYYLGGFVEATARRLFDTGAIRHLVRWGGDWDRDHDHEDQSFDDLVHYELYEAD